MTEQNIYLSLHCQSACIVCVDIKDRESPVHRTVKSFELLTSCSNNFVK